jgi:anti-sigma factor RsiW
MKCEELVELLSDYIDGNLDEQQRAEAEAHLAHCHNCHIVLDTTQKTILLYRAGSVEKIPVDHRQEMLERIKILLKESNTCETKE